jgi:PHD/YefM family antitoxin component YafN of YafNO toxin-antitoxin module
MTPLSRAIALAILSAILCAALAGCGKTVHFRTPAELTHGATNIIEYLPIPGERVSIPVSTFEKMLGQGSPDTNFISRMEYNAARLTKEELQNSNNWAAMRTILQQIDQRLVAVENRLGTGLSVPPVSAPAPLQSAPAVPQVPPIEKGKP